MGYLRSYRTPGGQRRFSTDEIERFVSSLGQSEPRRGRITGRLSNTA
jgi:hypothetical protein